MNLFFKEGQRKDVIDDLQKKTLKTFDVVLYANIEGEVNV